MTISEAMNEIESYEFAARLNVASDLRTFLRAAQTEPSVNDLLQELDSPEKRLAVLSKVFELSQRQIDLSYENPWDSSLAIYVWSMSLKDLGLAKAAAETAIQAPQCWWAVKLSRKILLTQESPMPSASSSTMEPTVQITAGPALQTFASAPTGISHVPHSQFPRPVMRLKRPHIEWAQGGVKAEARHSVRMEWSSMMARGEAA
jgi:hypothetical protein